MSFRENLRRKIDIDRLHRKVLDSLPTAADAVQKVDKDGMRELLQAAGYRRETVRDLELYLGPDNGGEGLVLVLDNGLGLYRTEVADVALRKSPTVKEMISIRNAIRILKDDDVLLSKKGESVDTVHRQAMGRLDLRYGRADLDEIRAAGASALESGDATGVVDALELFAEMLDWQPPPKAFRVRHGVAFGKRAQKPEAGVQFGPAVVFDRMDSALRMTEEARSSGDAEAVNAFHRMAEGRGSADAEGGEVFRRLADLTWEKRPSIG